MERNYSEYLDLLKSGKFIRENYFSKTYRVTARKTDGSKEELDLYHIQIPFSERKEKELQARFGIKDDELEAYYKNFYNNINKSIDISLSLHKLCSKSTDNENKRIANRTAFIREYQVFNNNRKGSCDIFILFDKHEPFVGTVLRKKNRKADLIEIADRLLQMCKAYSSVMSIGYIDIDSLLVRTDENGNTYIENPFFLGAKYEIDTFNAPTKDIAFFMPDSIADGSRQPDTMSDYAAVATLILTMLEGRHYNNKPDSMSCLACGENLRNELMSAIGFKADYSALKAALIKEKDINPDEIITFDKPFYANDFADIHKKYAKQEKSEFVANGRKPSKKLAALLIAAVCVIAVTVAIIAGINLNKPNTINTIASEAQLYSLNGNVVDYYGNPIDRYCLSDGNIVSDTSKIPKSIDQAEYTENVVTDCPDNLTYNDNLIIPITQKVLTDCKLSLGKIVKATDNNGFDNYLKIIRITDTELYCCECRAGEIYKGMDDTLYNILTVLEREDEILELTPKSVGKDGKKYIYYDANGKVYSADVNEINEALKAEIAQAKEDLTDILAADGEIVVPAEAVPEYNCITFCKPEKEKYIVTLSKDKGSSEKTEFVVKINVPAEATCRDFRVTVNKSEGLVIPWDYNAANIISDSDNSELISAAFRPDEGQDFVTIVLRSTETDTYRLLLSSEAGNINSMATIIITDKEGYTEDIPEVIEIPEEALVSPSPSALISPSPTKIPRVVQTPTPKATKKASDSDSSDTSSGNKGTTTTAPKATASTVPTAPQTTAPQKTEPPATEAPPTTPKKTAKPKPTPAPTEYIHNDDPFTVTPSSITLHVGESVNLQPSQSCTFYPSDPVVINMSGRTVIGMEPGSCHITIISMESDQQCTVSVTVVE